MGIISSYEIIHPPVKLLFHGHPGIHVLRFQFFLQFSEDGVCLFRKLRSRFRRLECLHLPDQVCPAPLNYGEIGISFPSIHYYRSMVNCRPFSLSLLPCRLRIRDHHQGIILRRSVRPEPVFLFRPHGTRFRRCELTLNCVSGPVWQHILPLKSCLPS